jgi:hypothetical protein
MTMRVKVSKSQETSLPKSTPRIRLKLIRRTTMKRRMTMMRKVPTV